MTFFWPEEDARQPLILLEEFTFLDNCMMSGVFSDTQRIKTNTSSYWFGSSCITRLLFHTLAPGIIHVFLCVSQKNILLKFVLLLSFSCLFWLVETNKTCDHSKALMGGYLNWVALRLWSIPHTRQTWWHLTELCTTKENDSTSSNWTNGPVTYIVLDLWIFLFVPCRQIIWMFFFELQFHSKQHKLSVYFNWSFPSLFVYSGDSKLLEEAVIPLAKTLSMLAVI